MRPKIICHMVTSIDARLHPSHWALLPGGADLALMRRHSETIYARLPSDGWMVGRVTMAEMARGAPRDVPLPDSDLRDTHVADRRDRKLAVVFDPHGRVHYGKDEVGGDHVVAVLSDGVSDAYLAQLQADGVSYLFAGPDGRDLARGLEILGNTFEARTLMLEGGGKLNGAFPQAGLIDEISLVAFPAVDGLAGGGTIFDAEGSDDARPAAGQALCLAASEVMEGGLLWLHYDVVRRPISTPQELRVAWWEAREKPRLQLRFP